MPRQTPRGDLVDKLREADARFAAAKLSPAAEARLQQLVGGERPSRLRPLVPVLVPVGVALVALAAWAVVRIVSIDPPQPQRRQPQGQPFQRLAGFDLAGGNAVLEAEDVMGCTSARCELQLAGAPSTTRLVLQRRARVRRRGRHVELLAGKVRCLVDKRPTSSPPLRVYVSHGRIEVIGTRFALRQQAKGGSVHLEHGAIRFVDRDDPERAILLRPGQRLSWPLPKAAPAEKPRDDGGHKRPRPHKRPSRQRDGGVVDSGPALLIEVERLRGRGRYREAAAALRRGLSRVTDRATRERLSFELGSILSDHLADQRAACRHWRDHLARFGARRYGTQIAAARRRLTCP